MTDTTTTTSAPYYDPYDVEINADPYPAFRQLREEAPLYYNEQYDFFAVSRYDDVERSLVDRATFISGRGGILELIKADIEMPSGVIIFEDPPTHTIHRSLLSRMFTPRKVAGLEGKIREFCAASLDPLVGEERFDIIAEFGTQMPMKVISMLLGIPEGDQEFIRDRTDATLRTEAGKPMDVAEDFASGDVFADYIDWRAEHPSDDIMTELLNVEFEDETGTVRRLRRDELLTYIAVVAGAGNETTNRLIGWMTKLFAEHPDQRRQVAADRALIPNAVEEVLRYEPIPPSIARYVAKDIELHGQTVAAGNAMLLLVGAANRDDRKYGNGDTFDINRPASGHLSFGYGSHFCLGAALARLEGRIALDEILNRWTDWDIDLDTATLSSTSTVRGWETLPVLPK